MTESNFSIDGITCNNCVATLTKVFGSERNVQEVKINKEKGELILIGDKSISTDFVQKKLSSFPKYKLSDSQNELEEVYSFKPLVLIIGFILLIVILSQVNNSTFDLMQSMRYFMGGFFICFSFFKFLDLDGFASAYESYDIVAGQWKTWAYIYPFVELSLGILYIINFMPIWTNFATLIVMGVSSIGVIKAVSSKKKIQCACLGTGFNLPMTTVTIIEDLGMVSMAAVMLLSLN